MADTASMVGVRRLGTLQAVVGAVTRGVHIPQASAPHLMLTTRPRGELEPFGWNEHNILTTGDAGSRSRQRAHAVSRAIRQAEVICFCVTSDTPYYRTWATQSAGSWVQIAATMETSALLAKLRSLVNDVATVAADVHAIAGGSVRRYLELAPAERQRRLRANG